MRKIVLTILFMLIVILSVFAYKYYTRTTYITEDEAKEIVLNDLNSLESDLTFNKIEYEYKETSDTYIYTLEFNDSNYTYVYKVDAKNEKIIYSKKEEIVYNGYISEDKVREIVCENANLNNDECNISLIEFIDDEETPTYEVTFYYNNIKYQYTINAYTGSIITITHINLN